MNQNDLYTDYNNIDLDVTLKTGTIHNGLKLKCFLLRTYSEQYDACDAHALIYFSEINGIRVNGKRIELTDYSTFQDSQGQVWKIDNYRENSPPEAPGLIFRLKSSS
ncbi:hypothetical protein [uncultured Nostoc sp.]|uniref:hypothetical protein n=1 Tax=uncultured Nostoc sp. TaxID=340711 RepID=UPI0035CBDDB9